MKFKRQIVNFLPYGLWKKISVKRYLQRKRIQYNPSFPDIEDVKTQFQNIVSVQGFGFSGSGAVVDLLREFTPCLVLGSIDREGSKTKSKHRVNGEMDILRHSGGLFEIEKYLSDNNLFIKDALIKRFVKLVDRSPIFINPKARHLANQFYSQLIDFEIDTKGVNSYNKHLANDFLPDSNIKVMKDLSIEQYRVICKKFLSSLFNLFYSEGYRYYVLDQLCCDFNFNYDQSLQYIPNLKTIIVYRDPRDVYAYSIIKDVPWIPHSNVNDFIKWYKINNKNLDFLSPHHLIVRFEDLVFDYEAQKRNILNYLAMREEEHVNQYECFDPKESAKNVAIWKLLSNNEQNMSQILHELPDYCYNV